MGWEPTSKLAQCLWRPLWAEFADLCQFTGGEARWSKRSLTRSSVQGFTDLLAGWLKMFPPPPSLTV